MIDTCPTSTPQLLLIEDDPVSRHLVNHFMDRLNRHLDTAASGQEALDLCRQQDYDLILMDLHIPEMDGYATRRHILDILSGKDIPPIICLTADTRPETLSRLRQEGFCECLYKPLDMDLLEATLDRYLPMSTSRVQEPAAEPIPPQLRAELYRMFVDSLSGEYQRLTQTRDRDELAHIAHTLAGNAAICGVTTLSHTAIKLDQSLRIGSPEQSQAYLELLLHLIDPLLEQAGSVS